MTCEALPQEKGCRRFVETEEKADEPVDDFQEKGHVFSKK